MEHFARTRREPRGRRLAAATLATALAVGLASAAHAQLGGTLGGLVGDTELTPVPKPVDAADAKGPASQWKVMAGARFGGQGRLFENSPTPYTVDFFSTAFSPSNPPVGFFAGAQCKDETISFDELEEEGCVREPAIYRLDRNEFDELRVERVLDPDEEEPDENDTGYVGALAWIDSERALAVGGTGTYPRREPATPVDDPSYVDPAGDARAWLYENGAWRELKDEQDPPGGFTGKDGDEIPDEMAGMTALDCGKPGLPLYRTCLAGGLQRLWWWSSGFDPAPVKDVENAAGQPDFRFRVRAIRFVPFTPLSTRTPMVLAATSGCCAAPGGPSAGPRVLSYFRIPTKSWWRSDNFGVS